MARPKNPSIQAIAELYNVSYHTAGEWLKKGCPKESGTEQDKWVASQKRTHNKSLDNTTAVNTPVKQHTPQLSDKSGASQALSRLEAEELFYYNELENAKASGDAMGIRTARDNWLKIGDSLRKYDIALEEARRTSGVSIPKDMVLKVIHRFAQASRVALIKSKQSVAPQLAAESDVVKIDKLIDKLLGQVWVDATNDMLGNEIPDWLKQSIVGELNKVTDE
jgi:hypothetical protein